MELQKVPGKVQLAIRPDEISITLDEQNKGVEAKVLLTEPLGGDMLVDVLLDGDKILIKTKPNFQGQMGDTCYLNFDSSRWHLFDCDSGLSYF